jgi:Tfp pilus assembly protein PilF
VQAYDLYLLGRQKWITRKVPLLREAIQHFEQAIARDSSFALAWSGMADAITALAWRVPSELPRVPEAKHAAQRALLLDAELAEAWASLGVLATYIDRDLRSAELAFRRAIALRPSYAPAYHWLADVMEYSGRLEEAVELSTRAIELDPMNGFHYGSKVEQLQSAGRFTEARQDADRLLAIGYREREVFLTILSGARAMGYSADEAAEFGRGWAAATGFPRPEDAALIGRAFIEPALRLRARELLETMAGENVRARDLAMFSLGVADSESAIKYLEQALTDGDPSLLLIGTVRAYDPLRKDPRFIRLTEQLGVPNGL